MVLACYFMLFCAENQGARSNETEQRKPRNPLISKGSEVYLLLCITRAQDFSRFLPKKAGLPAGVGGEPTSQGPPCNGSNGATYR